MNASWPKCLKWTQPRPLPNSSQPTSRLRSHWFSYSSTSGPPGIFWLSGSSLEVLSEGFLFFFRPGGWTYLPSQGQIIIPRPPWFRWHFPFASWQPTLLCVMLTDPSTYCLLEGIKLFFDSMSIQLNQHDKTLSPGPDNADSLCPLWSFWYSLHCLQRIFTLHWIWAPKIYSKC